MGRAAGMRQCANWHGPLHERTGQMAKWIRCQDGTLLNAESVHVIRVSPWSNSLNVNAVLFSPSGEAEYITVAEYEFASAFDHVGLKNAERKAEDVMRRIATVLQADTSIYRTSKVPEEERGE
jgi:hypothetical protein